MDRMTVVPSVFLSVAIAWGVLSQEFGSLDGPELAQC